MGGVWGAFQELDRGRGVIAGFRPQALSYTEIDAWARLRGVRLTEFELGCVRVLDAVYLQSYAEATQHRRKA